MIRITTLLAIAALALSACGDTAPETPAAPEAAATAAAAVEAKPAATAEAKSEEVALAETSMDDVEVKLASGDCTVVDANSASTREKNGVIEGAVLLDNYRTYDFASLPAEKDASVIFYCGSTMCTASDKAANRAMQAGYTNVSVMREGIKGWKKAGKKTIDWSAPATGDKQEG